MIWEDDTKVGARNETAVTGDLEEIGWGCHFCLSKEPNP